jgi:two-component system nitrogen regulation sensor histidine kinase NtrY
MAATPALEPSSGLIRNPIRTRWVVALGTLLVALFLALVVQIDLRLVEQLTVSHTLALIVIDLAALLLLVAYVVVVRATQLFQRARAGMIGTRLQSRIVIMFCVIAIVPTLAVSSFSAFFFNYGIKSWFDTRVASALEDSVRVASAYLDEHKNAIRTDALSVGTIMQQQLPIAFSNPTMFKRTLNQISAAHNLSEAVVLDGNHVVARTTLSFSLIFERLPEELLTRADSGNVVVFGEDEDKIQALLRISSRPRLYLMIGRVVDPTVLEHMESARSTVERYQRLQQDIDRLQQQFFLVFLLVAFLVLMASVWAGMMLAVRLIDPLIELMAATERVRAGDYSIKVPEGRPDDEIANLGRTFNRMTGQLEAQRRDILDANRQLDERRRFTEAVLSGVSAGILAIDTAYKITLCNRTALELLGCEAGESYTGRRITDLLPQVEALLLQAENKPEKIAAADIVVEFDGVRNTLHVQVVAEQNQQHIEGFIVTFDDITDLVSAQRSAAWADVARRIAHEIKNPLTPITLSAERLRKKFGPDAESEERESYERYIDTIARHSRDIGRMVEEFASFARMPTPNFREEDLGLLIRKAVFSEQTVNTAIRYMTTVPDQKVLLRCDETHLRQALLNLIKNAAEALEQKTDGEKEIRISLLDGEKEVQIKVEDNGPGFPADKIATLTEPYVTTRVKGTGLGLAIVKRSMEEHRGTIELSNRAEGGASVTLTLPKN